MARAQQAPRAALAATLSCSGAIARRVNPRVCLPGASYLSASALERSSVAAAKEFRIETAVKSKGVLF